jgi:pantoate--beta-alanine ligase
MYPGNLDEQTVVYVPKIGDLYCGKDRPEHFYGVTTVVSRLFNMVQPDIAVFGNKDYQQISIIRRMVEDLAYPIQVVGVDTVRSDDGLALSSRNGYLSAKELQVASSLQQRLRAMADLLKQKPAVISKSALKSLEDDAKADLKQKGFRPQYITVCRQSDLKPAKKGDQELVILAAAQLGKARLIDSIEVFLGQP